MEMLFLDSRIRTHARDKRCHRVASQRKLIIKRTGGGKTFVGLFHCDSAFIETLLNPYEFFHVFKVIRMLICK